MLRRRRCWALGGRRCRSISAARTALSSKPATRRGCGRLKAKFHYTDPTGPDQTRTDFFARPGPQTRVSDKVRTLRSVGSGRVRVVEFSYNSTDGRTLDRFIDLAPHTTRAEQCQYTGLQLKSAVCLLLLIRFVVTSQ